MAAPSISLSKHPQLTPSRAVSYHYNHNRSNLAPNSLPFPITTDSKRPPQPSNLLSLTINTTPFKVLSRRGTKESKPLNPDPVYRNRLVTMFVNRIMKGGKKSLAFFIIYEALKRIQRKTATNPLLVLRQAVMRVTPDVAVKPRRVGGSTVQVPVEVGSVQGKAIAIRWLLEASENRPGKSMIVKLSGEVVDAANGTGEAVRKKENTYRMAEANRAFSHFG